MGKKSPKAYMTLRKLVAPPSSQRKIARIANVSQPTICQLVNETYEPKEPTKRKLKRAFGIPLEDWQL